MKTTAWMTVVMAGLSFLPACGGEDLSPMETENLVQTNQAIALGGSTYSLTARGGTTGFPTQSECPSGYVAVGLHGRAATYIDRLGLLCRVLNADGSFGATYYAGAQGGFGGNNVERACPAGKFLVGFQGSGSSYVDSISLQCASPAPWMAHGDWQNQSGSMMGSSGGTSFEDRCSPGFVVTSLNVRVGGYVDQMQGICTQLY
ncbi:hypothetical protein [Melittangium boletus]|uniref:hypothetical protein n=1 Tax=Melittangium boletus TaxID=83453 RepID=UPI003DA2E2F5